MKYYDEVSADARKYHYWRGVRSALLVSVPVMIFLTYTLTVATDALLSVK